MSSALGLRIIPLQFVCDITLPCRQKRKRFSCILKLFKHDFEESLEYTHKSETQYRARGGKNLRHSIQNAAGSGNAPSAAPLEARIPMGFPVPSPTMKAGFPLSVANMSSECQPVVEPLREYISATAVYLPKMDGVGNGFLTYAHHSQDGSSGVLLRLPSVARQFRRGEYEQSLVRRE